MQVWLKLIAITVILPTAGIALLWCLATYMRKSDERSRIVLPWELTADEVERLFDMPDHLVLYGSDDAFNAWLRRDMPGLPRPAGVGSGAGIREL